MSERRREGGREGREVEEILGFYSRCTIEYVIRCTSMYCTIQTIHIIHVHVRIYTRMSREKLKLCTYHCL